MKKYFYFLPIFIIPICAVLSLNIESFFMGDTLIKLIQAQSLLENNFTSDEIRCSFLSEFGSCKFLLDGFFYLNNKLVGPFPVALSFIIAFILKLFSPNVLIWFGLLLFFCLNLLVYYIWKPRILTLYLILFATPIFFHSITFLDVILSTLFLILGLSFILFNETSNIYKLLLAGFLLGLSLFFRIETIFFVFFFLLLKLFYSREYKVFWVLLSYGVTLLLFFTLNYFLYSDILGARLIVNKGGIFSTDLEFKFSIIQSLLFYGEGRIGFFGYMPYLFVFLLLFPFFYKDIKPKNEQQDSISVFFASLFSIISVSIFSPNNSNIDWGSRYLTFLILPLLLTLDKLADLDELQNPFKKKLLLGIFTILFLFSVYATKKYYNSLKDFSKKSLEIKNFFMKQNSEIWVFTNHYLLNFAGKTILEKPVLFVKTQFDVENLILYLKSQKRYSTISFFYPNNIIQQMKHPIFSSDPKLDAEIKQKLSNEFTKLSEDSNFFIITENFQIKLNE